VLGHELAHHTHRTRDLLRVVGIAGAVSVANRYLLQPVLQKRFPQFTSTRTYGALNLTGEIGASLAVLTSMQRGNEFEADRESAELTRNPQAMIGALESLTNRVHHLDIEEQKKPNADPNWLAHIKRAPLSILPTHPLTSERIERLRKMDEAMHGKNAATPADPACEPCSARLL